MADHIINANLRLHLTSPNVKPVIASIERHFAKGINLPLNIKGLGGATLQGHIRDVDNLGKSFKRTTGYVTTFAESIGISARRFLSFGAAAAVLATVSYNMRNAVVAALEFDRQMIRLKQVGGDSFATISHIEKAITKMGVSLGVSSKDMAEAAVTIRQAGFSARDTAKALEVLGKTTLSPTFEDIKSTTEGLISVTKQFNIQAGQLENTFSAISKVSADYAVESTDLVEAIKRTGGAFKAAGGNVNELLAMFTAIRGTTRESSESIATGLKTIVARLQDPKIAQSLRNIGVEVYDLQGQFIGPYKAIEKLSAALTKLPVGNIQVAQVLKDIGGLKQYSRIVPLIYNVDTMREAYGKAMQSAGTLSKDTETAQQALLVQTAKLKESFLDLFRVISTDASVRSTLSFIIQSIQTLTGLMRELKPLIPVFLAFTTFKGLQWGFRTAGEFKKGFTSPVKGYASGGYVTGGIPGQDSVPAMLEPGEYVIPRKMAKGGVVDFMKDSNKSFRFYHWSRKRYLAGLNEEERESLKHYHMSSYINKLLNTGQGINHNYEKLLNRAITKGSISHPTRVYRAISGYDQFDSVKNIGDIIEPKQFISTSISPRKALNFGDKLVAIDLPKYLSASYVPPHDLNVEELEILLGNNNKFRLKEFGNRNVFEAIRHNKFAKGGFISGGVANKDSVPAILMPGEFVLNKAAAQRIGYGRLDRWNKNYGYIQKRRKHAYWDKPLYGQPGEFNSLYDLLMESQQRHRKDMRRISGDYRLYKSPGYSKAKIIAHKRFLRDMIREHVGGSLPPLGPLGNINNPLRLSDASKTPTSDHIPSVVYDSVADRFIPREGFAKGGIVGSVQYFSEGSKGPIKKRKMSDRRRYEIWLEAERLKEQRRPPEGTPIGHGNITPVGAQYDPVSMEANDMANRIEKRILREKQLKQIQSYEEQQAYLTSPYSLASRGHPTSELPIPSGGKNESLVSTLFGPSATMGGGNPPIPPETFDIEPIRGNRPKLNVPAKQYKGLENNLITLTPQDLAKQKAYMMSGLNGLKDIDKTLTQKFFPTFSNFFKGIEKGSKTASGQAKGIVSKLGGKLGGAAVGTLMIGGMMAPQLTEHVFGQKSRTGSAIGGTLSGAATGAAIGSMAGPWGTALGALAGAAMGAAGALRQLDEEAKETRMQEMENAFSKVNFETGKLDTASRQTISDQLQKALPEKQIGFAEKGIGGKFIDANRVALHALSFGYAGANAEEVRNPTQIGRYTALQNISEDERAATAENLSKVMMEISKAHPEKTFQEIAAGLGTFTEMKYTANELLAVDQKQMESTIKGITANNRLYATQEKLNTLLGQVNKEFELTLSELEAFGSALQTSGEQFSTRQHYMDMTGAPLAGNIMASPNNVTLGNLGRPGTVAGDINEFARRGGGYDQSRQQILDIINKVGPENITNLSPEEAAERRGTRGAAMFTAGGTYNERIKHALQMELNNPKLGEEVKQGHTAAIADKILQGVKPIKEAGESGNAEFQKAYQQQQQHHINQLNRQFELSQERAGVEIQKGEQRSNFQALRAQLNPDQFNQDRILANRGILNAKQAFAESQSRFGAGGLSPEALVNKYKTAEGRLTTQQTEREKQRQGGANIATLGKLDAAIENTQQEMRNTAAALKNLHENTSLAAAAQKKYEVAMQQFTADYESRKKDADVMTFGSKEEKMQLLQRENITQQALSMGHEQFAALPDQIKKIVYERLQETQGQSRTIQQYDKYGRERGVMDITGEQALDYFRRPALNKLTSSDSLRRSRNRANQAINMMENLSNNQNRAGEALRGLKEGNIGKQAIQGAENFDLYINGLNEAFAKNQQATEKFLQGSAELTKALNNFQGRLQIERNGTIQVILNGGQLIKSVKTDLEKEILENVIDKLKIEIQKGFRNQPAR